MASQTQTGTDRSAAASGLGYKQWTRKDLAVILSHYGVRFGERDSNNVLIGLLNELAAQRGLTREDRLTIINAHKAGTRLPSRKPVIRAPTVRSTITQPVVAHPVITQTEEHSSGTSDGSDVGMSKDELAEELRSLSEEEREYTATMSMPNSTGQRRTRGLRLTASEVANRPLLVSRPVVGNRPATVNSRAPIRRSNPASANRQRSTIHSGLNHLARPRATRAATTIPPRSEPAAPQAIKALNHECLICYDPFDPVKTLVRQPTLSCVHEVNICRPCLAASISSQLETKLWTHVGCPTPACEELLEYGDVQKFAEPHIFSRYFEFTFQAAQVDSHFQRCRTPGCKSGQQCFPEDTIMNCQECHRKTCITCDTEMHPGISCGNKEKERQAAQQTHEEATTGYLKTQAKMCPGCQAPSQKTGGCDHMTCKICGYEYCWRCLADHGPINEEGNHHHAPYCRHHSNNP
ncbi:hypothetical protein HO173_008304 [Letharia columbiana]|uniref:RBR-type E3 ubiquitin transferase n=1 Tax=Letharia columbiana TaxID=112416 RepID=A0A8H6L2T3_9LECA|nr:uncharacterized protein HO173_008304 [Letharia columbiana]KAF6233372.1 hypothetical protein HO173_008304 [Letharia columbiana]